MQIRNLAYIIYFRIGRWDVTLCGKAKIELEFWKLLGVQMPLPRPRHWGKRWRLPRPICPCNLQVTLQKNLSLSIVDMQAGRYYSGLLTQKFPRAFDADRDDRLSFKEWQVGFYLLILLPKVGNHNHDVHDVSVSWPWSDKWLPPMCDWQAKAKQSAGSRHERSQQGWFLACYGGMNVKYRMVFLYPCHIIISTCSRAVLLELQSD